ncbi:MAG: ABC transporter ATP-binding protein [Candidatus Bathyarchaeota archaeon]|nr:ABC transporter ATP-binding protein [Candidatus Bathyarchaeota archaeon]
MIELTNVSKKYGSTYVLKDINLKIGAGEFICIRGKSGVGKTTLLKIMGFLDAPDQGEVKLLGKEVQKMGDSARSDLRLNNVGFVFQFFNLIPSLTVLENIELPLALAKFSKSQRKERAFELINYFGLTKLADRFPESLSGGERQRIAVIRALANSPKLIIADEPTSSIDDENTQLLIDLFTSINQQKNVTIVFSTTDLYEKLPVTTDYLLKDAQLIKNSHGERKQEETC